jgi:hypothetical protein
VLGLLDDGMVENLQIVNGTAVALIALTAGTELRIDVIRPLIRSIVWISVAAVAAAATALAAAVFLMRADLPFLASLGAAEAAAVAVVIGLILVAPSPAVVVALREELEADGAVTRVVLGTVVLANLAVIVLFPVASAAAKLVGGAGADISAMLRHIAWELAGSLLAGLVVALLITAYLRFVRRGATLFVLTAAFVVAEVGRRLGLDPLLVSLAAGLAIRNATSFGDVLHARIGASSLPIYVTFFAVTGATLHVEHLAPVAVPALVLIAVRAAALVAAARAGARMAGAPAEVERWAPLGLLPQAGLALALTLLFVRTFPEIGPAASSLLLGIVALNEIFAPAIYRWALIRSGDIGRAATPPVIQQG